MGTAATQEPGAALQAEADKLLWFHSIDLGNGVRTRGMSELAVPLEQLPPLAGRSVLDIGAWDGYYSFLAERAGASRVVALDHYAWGVDLPARQAYWNECIAKGQLPDHGRDETDFWRPELPGRRGFEFAHRALGSRVEPVVADLMTADLDALGTFDVVIYLGVLYHMKEPLTALQRVRQVTREVAVVETEAIAIDGLENQSLLRFEPGGELNTDFGNWYVPTLHALRGLCRAAGFSRVETVVGPPPGPLPVWEQRLRRAASIAGDRASVDRALEWLQALEARRSVGTTRHYRAIVHAFV